MASESLLRCDGCGQAASPEHVARRLRRLEWTTRYRPIHIATLLLGAVAPDADWEFLYAPEMKFEGESRSVLESAGVAIGEKASEERLTEFQRGGLLLAHVLECPVGGDEPAVVTKLLEQRIPFVAARIRRSLKPKRVALISRLLGPLIPHFQSASLGCPLLLDGEKAFALDGEESIVAAGRLREALASTGAVK
jgi:hypothetical protein